jgi:hypothetical protein
MNLDCGIPYKFRLWYTVKIKVLVCDINLSFGIEYKFRFYKSRFLANDINLGFWQTI